MKKPRVLRHAVFLTKLFLCQFDIVGGFFLAAGPCAFRQHFYHLGRAAQKDRTCGGVGFSGNQSTGTHDAAVCQLDIYGQVDPSYQERFDEICRNLPQGVRYNGFVDFSQSVQVLRQYDGLLFPTYYSGEGYANTIVDAYASALPVIATDWKYNSEVVSEGSDGRLYDYRCPEKLTQILEEYVADPDSLLNMRKNARLRAFDYEPTTAITALRENIDNG